MSGKVGEFDHGEWQPWFVVQCVNYLNYTCEGDVDISTKHELAAEQDSTCGHPQPCTADDCQSTRSQSATDTGRNPSPLLLRSRRKLCFRGCTRVWMNLNIQGMQKSNQLVLCSKYHAPKLHTAAVLSVQLYQLSGTVFQPQSLKQSACFPSPTKDTSVH